MEISALAKKYAAWSISKAGIAETCPAQFKHKYLLKTSEASVSSASVGTAAHTILEYRVSGTPKEEAQKLALEKTPLTSNELDDLMTFHDTIDNFLQRFDRFCKANNVIKVFREVEWGFTEEYKPAGFFDKDVFFRGKLDLCALTADHDLWIIDHKSGVAKNIQQDQKKKHQLYSYATLALANIEDLAGVRAGIHFLQGPEDLRLQWLNYIDAPRIQQSHVPWLFQHLNYVAEQLEEPFIARPRLRWPCEWCGFQTECAAYQEMMNCGA